MKVHPIALIEQVLAQMVRGWDRFWFQPTSPNSLGLIRITVGVIVLYVHFLYSFQLFEYFGKDAWINLETSTAMRTESPIPHVLIGFSPPMFDPSKKQILDTVVGPVEIPPIESLPLEEQQRIGRYMQEWGGNNPQYNLAKGAPYWSVWFHVTDPTAMVLVHIGVLVIMLMFTLGLATRITSVLTWLAAMCYIHRSQSTLFGMDTMMNVLLMYLMIGPSGAALSLDRWIQRWWVVRQAKSQGQPVPSWNAPAPLASACLALRLIQIHFCIIYFAAGTSKLLGSTWWSGTALWLCWANYEFAPLTYKVYEDFLVFLCRHRVLWEMMATSAVVFTLVMELGLPFLIWMPRTRWLMIIGAVMLHTGIALSMGLTTFGMLMMCMLLAFVPQETVDRLVAKLPCPAWLV